MDMTDEILFEAPVIRQNTAKFKELILYISRECKDAKFMGKTKLNKMLFGIDFSAFEKLGSPVTGVRYKKIDHGPVPFPIKPVLDEMIEEGDLILEEEKLGSKLWQQRPVAQRPPDLSLFSEDELELINEWIEKMRDLSATVVRKWSHDLPIFEMPDDEGFLPYGRIYWMPQQDMTITEQDRSVMEELNQMISGDKQPQ